MDPLVCGGSAIGSRHGVADCYHLVLAGRDVGDLVTAASVAMLTADAVMRWPEGIGVVGGDSFVAC